MTQTRANARLDNLPICSVIMPAYNREAEIGRAIESVLRQTLTEFELLVIDDCSTDDTFAVASAYTDPRVSVHRLSQNSGAPRARNAGIVMAKAKWIAFQDSDDEWLPTMLDHHHRAFASPDVAVSYCQLEQRYRSGTRYYPEAEFNPSDNPYADLLKGSYISTQTLAVRKTALEAVGSFDEQLPRLQDWDLVLRLAQAGCSFLYTPKPLAIAYETANSLTKSETKGIIARETIISKHRDGFKRYPKYLSRHHYVIGSLHRAAGSRDQARKSFLASVRAYPLAFKAWVRLGQGLFA